MSSALKAYKGQMLNLLKSPLTPIFHYQFSRHFSKGLLSGGNNTQFQNPRNTNKQQYLLDKFVKHATYDGAFVVRVPFTIQVHIKLAE